MKVFCIKQGPWSIGGYNGPKYGEILTASQCPVYPDNYDIEEYPVSVNGIEASWAKRHFIPFSSICETEMEREYSFQTETA